MFLLNYPSFFPCHFFISYPQFFLILWESLPNHQTFFKLGGNARLAPPPPQSYALYGIRSFSFVVLTPILYCKIKYSSIIQYKKGFTADFQRKTQKTGNVLFRASNEAGGLLEGSKKSLEMATNQSCQYAETVIVRPASGTCTEFHLRRAGETVLCAEDYLFLSFQIC